MIEDREIIETGEFIRLKNGKIIKFERFGIYRTHPYDKENKTYTTQEHKAIISTEKKHYKYDNIVKHSKNIIDLIEVRRLCEWKISFQCR